MYLLPMSIVLFFQIVHITIMSTGCMGTPLWNLLVIGDMIFPNINKLKQSPFGPEKGTGLIGGMKFSLLLKVVFPSNYSTPNESNNES